MESGDARLGTKPVDGAIAKPAKDRDDCHRPLGGTSAPHQINSFYFNSPDNFASQKVIRANGGVLVEEFKKRLELGGSPELRFRVDI